MWLLVLVVFTSIPGDLRHLVIYDRPHETVEECRHYEESLMVSLKLLNKFEGKVQSSYCVFKPEV